MKRFAMGLVLSLCLAASGASAQEVQVRPETMQRISRALFVIEGEAPASFYASLGDEGRVALLSIVRDRARAVGLRRRAVLALRHYADAGVRAELEALASDLDEDAIVSRYAVRALALGFGASTFDFVRARLEDARPLVREGAAMELFALDPTRARPILEPRAAQDSERFVRDRIARLLTGS